MFPSQRRLDLVGLTFVGSFGAVGQEIAVDIDIGL